MSASVLDLTALSMYGQSIDVLTRIWSGPALGQGYGPEINGPVRFYGGLAGQNLPGWGANYSDTVFSSNNFWINQQNATTTQQLLFTNHLTPIGNYTTSGLKNNQANGEGHSVTAPGNDNFGSYMQFNADTDGLTATKKNIPIRNVKAISTPKTKLPLFSSPKNSEGSTTPIGNNTLILSYEDFVQVSEDYSYSEGTKTSYTSQNGFTKLTSKSGSTTNENSSSNSVSNTVKVSANFNFIDDGIGGGGSTSDSNTTSQTETQEEAWKNAWNKEITISSDNTSTQNKLKQTKTSLGLSTVPNNETGGQTLYYPSNPNDPSSPSKSYELRPGEQFAIYVDGETLKTSTSMVLPYSITGDAGKTSMPEVNQNGKWVTTWLYSDLNIGEAYNQAKSRNVSSENGLNYGSGLIAGSTNYQLNINQSVSLSTGIDSFQTIWVGPIAAYEAQINSTRSNRSSAKNNQSSTQILLSEHAREGHTNGVYHSPTLKAQATHHVTGTGLHDLVDGSASKGQLKLESFSDSLLYGGDGNDELIIRRSEPGNTFYAGAGNDKVKTRSQSSIELGDGDDLFIFKGGHHHTVHTGSGHDTIAINNSKGFFTVADFDLTRDRITAGKKLDPDLLTISYAKAKQHTSAYDGSLAISYDDQLIGRAYLDPLSDSHQTLIFPWKYFTLALANPGSFNLKSAYKRATGEKKFFKSWEQSIDNIYLKKESVKDAKITPERWADLSHQDQAEIIHTATSKLGSEQSQDFWAGVLENLGDQASVLSHELGRSIVAADPHL
tara:strand:+ start:211 stop:2541 length:2331 start_codon:yes stop_codon:yes gene_type:complete